MSKTVGGVRNVQVGGTAYRNRIREVAEMRSGGLYSSVMMPDRGTGYVAIEKSTAKHKPEEIEAALHLASHGYKVTLANEAGASTVKEGKLFLSTYEQRTPNGEHNDAKNITTALRHARDKKADISVIYMKYGQHSRKNVEQGIKDFESTSKFRFKDIIVITHDGRLHHHKHES
jgi:hypothetical protein